MAKYKDADRLMAILENRCDEADSVEAWLACVRACEDVRDLPDADVEEVRRGRWEHLGGDEWFCTACAHVITTEGSWERPCKKYCEECGAKMEV